jgi:hypothetical protein
MKLQGKISLPWKIQVPMLRLAIVTVCVSECIHWHIDGSHTDSNLGNTFRHKNNWEGNTVWKMDCSIRGTWLDFKRFS